MSVWCARRFLPIVMLSVCCVPGCRARTGAWPYVVQLGDVPLNVEVARTEAERRRGLMYRDRLDENWGMLFVYGTEKRLSFWMKNTKVPLSVAFIDREFVVRDIRHMTPLTKEAHPSRVAVMYALEVNRGWFAKHRIDVGTKVTFSPELRRLVKLR